MLLVSMSCFTQETKATLSIDEQADRLANLYDNQLALTAKQFLLFKNELKSTLEKRRLIEQRFSGKEKLDQLVTMQAYETAAMGDILTRIQFRRYKKIKPNLQPLDVVD
jgi:hypothetical protein